MNFLFVLLLMIFPLNSFAFLDDLFSANKCGHPQQNYPIEAQDEQHANEVYARDLERSRTQAEKIMPEINADLAQARRGLDYYFSRPWLDAMITHMDNGLDCCHSPGAVAQADFSAGRRPAGSDVVDTTYEIVDPSPYEDLPSTATPRSADPRENSGGLCLQTGFASTPEWRQQACRDGGRVDAEVCGDSQISKYPQDYRQCVQVLEEYYRLADQKRRLSAEIQAYNTDISALRRGRSEASPKGSGLGSFLKTVAPFLLMAYVANQSQKSVRHQYQDRGPLRSRPHSPLGRPNSLSGRYSGGGPSEAPRAPYYGENYGYPLQSEGVLGQILPAMMLGGFGCSEGSLGSGLDLKSLLGGRRGAASVDSRPAPYARGGTSGRYSSSRWRPYESEGVTPRSQDSGRSTGGRSGGLGQSRREAFFFSKLRESEARRERIWANDVYSSLGPTEAMMSSYRGSSRGSGSDVPYSAGAEPQDFLKSLFDNKGRATFTLEAFGGY